MFPDIFENAKDETNEEMDTLYHDSKAYITIQINIKNFLIDAGTLRLLFHNNLPIVHSSGAPAGCIHDGNTEEYDDSDKKLAKERI